MSKTDTCGLGDKTKLELRTFLRAVMTFVFLCQVGCGQGVVTNSSNMLAEEGKQTKNVLLEVWTEAKYVVYPPGKVLNIKLYDSGEAEYDYYPPQQVIGEEFKAERRIFRLDSSELARVKSLIADPELRKSNRLFKPTVPILDAAIETTVTYANEDGSSSITLEENHSNLMLEKKKEVYPGPLLELLLLVQRIDHELLEGQRPSTKGQ